MIPKRRGISPKERDAIVDALRRHPNEIEFVANHFGRGVTTIRKIQAKARIRSSATRSMIAASASARERRAQADRSDS